jgi:hypothetical protein
VASSAYIRCALDERGSLKRSIGIVLLVLAMGTLAAGIGSSVARTGSSGPPSGPDPAVVEWPAWPYETACGGQPFDPVAVFSGPTEAELGSGAPEAALREFLQKRPFPWTKPHFWRLVAASETTAEFVRGRLASQLEWVSFELKDGQWREGPYWSDCEPTSIAGNGPVVTWSLAPRKRPFPKWVRRVRVNLGPGQCSGGLRQNPRARVTFKPLGKKLLMIVWLKPLPPGNYTCPGVLEPPLMVRLPHKVRLSRLFDGATYPPTPVLERLASR